MNTPKIESGIPLPEPRRNRYPFESMKAGDSFLIEGGTLKREGQSVRSCAKRRGYKVTVDWDDANKTGIRVWMVGKL